MSELKKRAIFNQPYMVDKIGREDAENMFKNTIQPIIKVRYDGKWEMEMVLLMRWTDTDAPTDNAIEPPRCFWRKCP